MDLANLDLNKNSERVSRFPAGQVEIEFVPNDTTVRWLNYSTLTASVRLRGEFLRHTLGLCPGT